MPTKEKGKALTWMNEKKSETDAQGLPKRKQQGREKRNSGMQKKEKRSNAKRTSRGNKYETKGHPGAREQATPAPREAKTQKRQQCETHAHGRNKQETRTKRTARGGNGPRGQGLRNLHPGGWQWALGILTPLPSKNKAHI